MRNTITILALACAACDSHGTAAPDGASPDDAPVVVDDARTDARPGVDAMNDVDAAPNVDAMTNVDAASGCTPGAWTVETIDAAGDVGSVHDLASDSSGRLHVAYWDKTNGDLKYALRSSSGTWTSMVVDSANNVGGSLAIAVDAAGNPHIAYLDQTNSDLKYATRSGAGAWSTVVLDTEGAGLYPQIAVDSAGTLHIVYRGTGTLGDTPKYLYKPAAGAWTPAQGIGGTPSSLTTVGTTVHVAYAGTNEVILSSRSSPTAASMLDIDINTPRSQEFSLAIDANGGKHLSYHVFSTPQIGYAYKPAAGSWALITLDTADQTAGTNKLAVDAAGGVHVGYTARRFGADFDVRYAYKPANGSWSITTITAADDAGGESSFALAPSGAPHLTYYNRATLDLVHVSRCE